MKIKVMIKIPPGNTCHYPPKDDALQGYGCSWKIAHMASGKKWCRIFSDADVTSGLKCEECIKAMKEATHD